MPALIPKKPFGRTGKQVSVVGMGCSPFGHAYGVSILSSNIPDVIMICTHAGRIGHVILTLLAASAVQTPDESAAFKAVQEAFKQGVNFFDVCFSFKRHIFVVRACGRRLCIHWRPCNDV